MSSATPESGLAFGRDQVISKKELKQYMKRSDLPGLINFFGHMGVMIFTGFLVYQTLGTWWVVPTMAMHAAVLAFLFAPCHECSHGTPFRTRWLNEAVYWVVCLIYMVPPTFFRYYHATHHTYTQIRGKDPDMLPERMTVVDYMVYVSAYAFWKRGLIWMFKHPFGKIAESQKYFIPESEVPRATREARIILAIYFAVFVASIYFQSLLALWLWIVPRLVGEPLMRWIRLSEHGECEEGPDLRTNTRTTKTSRLVYFLFWNMPYHAEHHLCPMVPFHALGRMHEAVKDKLHPVGESYPKVHGEILEKISNKQGVTWEHPQTSS
ncbi:MULTISPECIES: fatty acid desaturase [unclassified Dinoroseobacter]|uniref:fatty acid desaturase n=1 Tax=unclassified Dinoroseobacter TaxID=2620028 RepID=UPI003C7C9F13